MEEDSLTQNIKRCIQNRILLVFVFTTIVFGSNWIGLWDIFGIFDWNTVSSAERRVYFAVIITVLTSVMWIVFGLFGIIRLYKWLKS